MKENYYDILEVSRTASQEVINNAYKALAKKYHPDNFATEKDKRIAEEKIKVVIQAYEILGDETKRNTYDKELNCEKKLDEPITEEKIFKNPLNKKQRWRRWGGVLIILLIMGTCSYGFFEYKQKQAIVLAEKKAEDELRKELAICLGKEALYLTMTIANNIDYQTIPYDEAKKYTDQTSQTIILIKEKQKIIERGNTIQLQRQANISDISHVAFSMNEKDLKEVTLQFKEMLIDDYAKNKVSYENKLKSSNSLMDFYTGKILQNNMFANIAVKGWVDDLNSKELMLDNPNYGASRQAIVGVLEKEMGKDSATKLLGDGKVEAIHQIHQDFQNGLADILIHFQDLLKY